MFTQAVLVVYVITSLNVLVTNEKTPKHRAEDSEEDDIKNNAIDDVHTFVALIDIVFTDQSKRTCTGSIIHDNVVITAAHCFQQEDDPTIQPELTASLVVIGTKKMFESGYEQYLPIERVLRHPNFSGWTADLALVYTFSGMTSDKPGSIIPLDGEKASTPVDSNVTVLSWGVCAEDDEYDILTTKRRRKSTTKRRKKDEHEDCDSDEAIYAKHKQTLMPDSFSDEAPVKPKQHLRNRYQFKQTRGIPYYRNIDDKQNPRAIFNQATLEESTRQQSIYLTSGESREPIPNNSTHDRVPRRPQKRNIKSLYTGWRRSMGTQKNKLTVEVFGFVNVQACKKIVEKSKPRLYRIRDTSEVVCYASEDHYITAEDSGSPAMRHGHLVAVTVGGAECDGDHVAIGMKMSCFCSWIAENLPDRQTNMKCCKNCCNANIIQKQDSSYRKRRN